MLFAGGEHGYNVPGVEINCIHMLATETRYQRCEEERLTSSLMSIDAEEAKGIVQHLLG